MRIRFIIFFLFFLSSCASHHTKTIEVLPVVLGHNEYMEEIQYEKIFNNVNELFVKLDISFVWSDIYYSNYSMEINQCDMLDGIQMLIFNDYPTNSKERIIVFLYYKNQSCELLGCSVFNGIRYKRGVTFINIQIDEKLTSYIIAHEIAHVLGANHTNDNSIMSENALNVIDWNFSHITRNEIRKNLSKVDF